MPPCLHQCIMFSAMRVLALTHNHRFSAAPAPRPRPHTPLPSSSPAADEWHLLAKSLHLGGMMFHRQTQQLEATREGNELLREILRQLKRQVGAGRCGGVGWGGGWEGR